MKKKVNIYIKKENGKPLITLPPIFERVWIDETFDGYEAIVDCSAFELRKEGDYIVTPFCGILVKSFDKSGYPYPVSSNCRTDFKWIGNFCAIDKINGTWYLTYCGIFEDYERGDVGICPSLRRTLTRIRCPFSPKFFGLCRLYPTLEEKISFVIENGTSFFLKKGEKIVGNSFVVRSYSEELSE